jgi:hypothetical protein
MLEIVTRDQYALCFALFSNIVLEVVTATPWRILERVTYSEYFGMDFCLNMPPTNPAISKPNLDKETLCAYY